jgi:hypothetical protein
VVSSKNGKEKQGRQDDSREGASCQVGWWKGSCQETSSRPKNNAYLRRAGGRLRRRGTAAIWRSIQATKMTKPGEMHSVLADPNSASVRTQLMELLQKELDETGRNPVGRSSPRRPISSRILRLILGSSIFSSAKVKTKSRNGRDRRAQSGRASERSGQQGSSHTS